MTSKEPPLGAKLVIAAVLLFILALAGAFTAGVIILFGGEGRGGANVAVIPVEGLILAGEVDSPFDGVVTSDEILESIARAEEDEAIKAVIFRINSPGGSAVASDEVTRAIRSMKKPSVAVIREVGASGAYWVASAADHVIANPASITGSIGVLGSYLSFGRFLDEWNVTYNRLVSGELKDVGTPFRELTPAEEQFLQGKLDAIHELFIREVARNRNLSVAAVRELADGRFFLGAEAVKAGLIDEVGTEEEALDWINATLGFTPVSVEYRGEESLISLLASLSGGRPPLARTPSLLAPHPSGAPMAR